MCSGILTCHLAGRESCDLRPDMGLESAENKLLDLEVQDSWMDKFNRAQCSRASSFPNARDYFSHETLIQSQENQNNPFQNSKRCSSCNSRFGCSANVQSKYSNAWGRMARATFHYKYLLKAIQEWLSEYSRNFHHNYAIPREDCNEKPSLNLFSRSTFGTAIAFFVLSTGTTAMGGGYNNHHSTNPSAVDLKLKLFGKIKPRCEIHLPKEKLWFEITDDADMRSVTFDLNCNQPLKVEVTSRNGGLEHTAHDRLPTYPGFTSFVEYDLDLALQAPGTNDLRFDSEDITNEPGRGHFGAIPHDTKGQLKISWAPTDNLIAGTYGDVIEIRVTGDSGSNVHW